MTAMDGLDSRSADLPQGRVAYREGGDGEPIVFVHGLLVDGRLWDGVAGRLANGFRCIVPDWPMGSHRTAMRADADLSPRGQAATVIAFMDALGLERATLVGNDSGGAVSQMLTAAHPERVERLVLTNCDTFEHFPPFPFTLMPRLARIPGGMTALTTPFRVGAVRRGIYRLLAKKPIPPELVDSWVAPSVADPGVASDVEKLLRGVSKEELVAADERLRAYRRPVRFVWADEDRFFKLAHAERLAATLPDAEIATVPDARTFVPLDQPHQVATLIENFMGATTRGEGAAAA